MRIHRMENLMRNLENRSTHECILENGNNSEIFDSLEKIENEKSI